MAYKDKDRQREAQKDWVRQKRVKDKGSTSEVLPLAVRQVIDSMSKDRTTGKTDEANKAKRTAAAKRYQQLFPNRHCCWTDQHFTKLMARA